MKKIRPISLFAFSCIVSIGTLLLYNIPFFNYVSQNTNESTGGIIFLQASLVIIMLALNFMLTYLAMWLLRIVARILLAIFAIINATAVYFIITYSAIINATTIENVFNTRYSEASGFFSWSLWLFIAVFGVLPALYCLMQPVVIGKAKKLGIYCGSSLAIILLVASLNISQTLWISQHDTELGGLLQPWSYVVNTCRVISSYQDEQAEEIKLPDGTIADHEKAVVVLVIGESARKANFRLYGYQRDTNPLLSKQEGLKVYQATACATYTTAGLSLRTAVICMSYCPTMPSGLVLTCRGVHPTGESRPYISMNISPTRTFPICIRVRVMTTMTSSIMAFVNV